MDYSELLEQSRQYRREGIDVVVTDAKEHKEIKQCLLDHMKGIPTFPLDEEDQLKDDDFMFCGVKYTRNRNQP